MLKMYIKKDSLVPICKFLKYHTGTQYRIFVDLTAVDFLLRKKRFQLVYHFLSLVLNSRIYVNLHTSSLETVNSIVEVYSVAGWLEREVWDLFVQLSVFWSSNSLLQIALVLKEIL